MKETFIMKTNFLTDDDIELFTPEEIGLLTIAWSRFVQTGTQPTRDTLPVHLIVKFNTWKEFYQFNEQKYQEKVQRMSEAQKKSKSDRKGALLTKTEQIESESESESESVSESDNKENSVSIQNIFDEHVRCECATAKGEQCDRRATYLINGKRYCNQHSRPVLSETIEGLNRSNFTPPSLTEVQTYCSERNNTIDPEYFLDYYTARDWVLSNGKKCRDWKACVRTWEKNGIGKRADRAPKQQGKWSSNISDIAERNNDYARILANIPDPLAGI